MTSSAITPRSPFHVDQKDVDISSFRSQPSFSFSAQTSKKRASKKIVSVMAPQQSERKPATTGAVKTGMTMTEKILARASEKTQLSPGDNVWVNVDVLMTHDVCGPGSIGIFKKEFGENAKDMAPKTPFKPRYRAHAALHMRGLAIENLHRTITRLRADLGKRMRESERLSEEKELAEAHRHQIQHQMELTREDNFELRDSIELSNYREKKLTEDVERYTKEIATSGKKFEEAWSTIMHLSEANEILTKQNMKLKGKIHQWEEKYQVAFDKAKQIVDEADEEIQGLKDEVAGLTHENNQLQVLIADLQNPEVEEDPEEEPEEEPVAVIEDPVVEDPVEGDDGN